MEVVSLAQLVGGVDLQTQHLTSNPHGREFMFLFILEDQTFLILMQSILRTRLMAGVTQVSSKNIRRWRREARGVVRKDGGSDYLDHAWR